MTLFKGIKPPEHMRDGDMWLNTTCHYRRRWTLDMAWQCVQETGHDGLHSNKEGDVWDHEDAQVNAARLFFDVLEHQIAMTLHEGWKAEKHQDLEKSAACSRVAQEMRKLTP